MSINVRQLHVGAHVLVYGKRVKVDTITDDTFGGYYAFTTDYNDCEALAPYEIEPIAITPELLTELGFENWS